MKRNSGFYKVYRFALIYGVRRALIKALGRLRVGKITRFVVNPFKAFITNKHISVVGCGQFTYATSTYFLVNELGNCIDAAFDTDKAVMESYAAAYDAQVCDSFEDILNRRATSIVYIASNHASHADYAERCIARGFDVYIEKPIAVSFEQFYSLKRAIMNSDSNVYVGYNRPFSKAIKELKSRMGIGPITLICSVVGHKLEQDHWYRNPDEGTRVCGNLGHWIDLAVHLLMARSTILKGILNISISYSNLAEPDDNFSVTIATEENDLIVLTMTSRDEPFEGISENVLFQQRGLLARIDDFRRAEFQIGAKKIKRSYFYKDVGHKKAILQPYTEKKRNIDEVFISTEVMLHIAQLVKNQETFSKYAIETNL